MSWARAPKYLVNELDDLTSALHGPLGRRSQWRQHGHQVTFVRPALTQFEPYRVGTRFAYRLSPRVWNQLPQKDTL